MVDVVNDLPLAKAAIAGKRDRTCSDAAERHGHGTQLLASPDIVVVG